MGELCSVTGVHQNDWPLVIDPFIHAGVHFPRNNLNLICQPFRGDGRSPSLWFPQSTLGPNPNTARQYLGRLSGFAYDPRTLTHTRRGNNWTSTRD